MAVKVLCFSYFAINDGIVNAATIPIIPSVIKTSAKVNACLQKLSKLGCRLTPPVSVKPVLPVIGGGGAAVS